MVGQVEVAKTENFLGCVFCNSRLVDTTKEAHVFPKTLGGRLKNTHTECSNCNEYFGRLEDRLAQRFLGVSSKVGAVTADGKRILVKIEIPLDGYTTGTVWGGTIEPTVLPPKFTIKDGKRYRYQVLPHDDEGRARLVARMLFDDGIKLEDFDQGKYEHHFDPWSNKTRRIDTGTFKITVGDRDDHRAFTKFAVSLIGHVDKAAARSSYLDDAVAFARVDRGDLPYWAEKSSPGSGLLTPSDLPTFVHAIEVWTYQKKLFAKMTFFGQMLFTTILATHWPRTSLSVAYAVDPTGSWQHKLLQQNSDGLPLGLVHPGSADEVAQEFVTWLEIELEKVADLAKDRSEAGPPDLAILNPMIRKYLQKLWKKGGSKPRGSKKRK